MALTKTQKQKSLENLKEKIEKQKSMVFVNFSGLKVEDLFHLRKKLKAADSNFLVAKKTLISLAFNEKGIKVDPKKMEGETALVFGYKDELSPAKIVYQFSKENDKLKILGGFFEESFKEAKDIVTIAQLPGKEELLARLTGSIAAPISSFVTVLEANIKGLFNILNNLKYKKNG